MSAQVAEPMTIRRIFDGTQYRVPVYQRAYAWGNDEIEALFSDVRDMRLRSPNGHYYVGTLVVHAERSTDDGAVVYDVVDGQQRLTTMLLTLANPTVRANFGADVDLPLISRRMLTFEGRDRSTGDIDGLIRTTDPSQFASIDDDGIRFASELVSSMVGRGQIAAADVAYLLDRVRIVRTLLPARTDLNHYFEIMNSRGEQLEKHEIVKALLMERVDSESDRHAFAAIWDLCSDMSRHVQAAAPKSARTRLFGDDWSTLGDVSFDQIGAALDTAQEASANRSILALLDSRDVPESAEAQRNGDDDEMPRYGTIIDFPNFLLHALRLHVSTSEDGPSVPLDDKSLVEQFRLVFTSDDAAGVKRFAECLLRSRFLFDNFIIRTDSVRDTTEDDSNWVIHRAHKVGERGKEKVSPRAAFGDAHAQFRVMMLQSMFQVTDSRRSYKEFLAGLMSALTDQWRTRRMVDADQLIAHLEELAAERGATAIQAGVDRGTAVQHFLFNYLDYLLWREFVVGGQMPPRGVFPGEFRFRYRKSVEHFYPVQPERDPLPIDVVNQFGNLCIMGRDENSRRSNLMPKAKINQYLSSDQSLKFQLMALDAIEADAWDGDCMSRHGDEMIEILRRETSRPRVENASRRPQGGAA